MSELLGRLGPNCSPWPDRAVSCDSLGEAPAGAGAATEWELISATPEAAAVADAEASRPTTTAASAAAVPADFTGGEQQGDAWGGVKLVDSLGSQLESPDNSGAAAWVCAPAALAVLPVPAGQVPASAGAEHQEVAEVLTSAGGPALVVQQLSIEMQAIDFPEKQVESAISQELSAAALRAAAGTTDADATRCSLAGASPDAVVACSPGGTACFGVDNELQKLEQGLPITVKPAEIVGQVCLLPGAEDVCSQALHAAASEADSMFGEHPTAHTVPHGEATSCYALSSPSLPPDAAVAGQLHAPPHAPDAAGIICQQPGASSPGEAPPVEVEVVAADEEGGQRRQQQQHSPVAAPARGDAVPESPSSAASCSPVQQQLAVVAAVQDSPLASFPVRHLQAVLGSGLDHMRHLLQTAAQRESALRLESELAAVEREALTQAQAFTEAALAAERAARLAAEQELRQREADMEDERQQWEEQVAEGHSQLRAAASAVAALESRVSALEAELQAERSGRLAAEQQCELLMQHLSSLQQEMREQREQWEQQVATAKEAVQAPPPVPAPPSATAAASSAAKSQEQPAGLGGDHLKADRAPSSAPGSGSNPGLAGGAPVTDAVLLHHMLQLQQEVAALKAGAQQQQERKRAQPQPQAAQHQLPPQQQEQQPLVTGYDRKAHISVAASGTHDAAACSPSQAASTHPLPPFTQAAPTAQVQQQWQQMPPGFQPEIGQHAGHAIQQQQQAPLQPDQLLQQQQHGRQPPEELRCGAGSRPSHRPRTPAHALLAEVRGWLQQQPQSAQQQGAQEDGLLEQVVQAAAVAVHRFAPMYGHGQCMQQQPAQAPFYEGQGRLDGQLTHQGLPGRWEDETQAHCPQGDSPQQRQKQPRLTPRKPLHEPRLPALDLPAGSPKRRQAATSRPASRWEYRPAWNEGVGGRSNASGSGSGSGSGGSSLRGPQVVDDLPASAAAATARQVSAGGGSSQPSHPGMIANHGAESGAAGVMPGVQQPLPPQQQLPASPAESQWFQGAGSGSIQQPWGHPVQPLAGPPPVAAAWPAHQPPGFQPQPHMLLHVTAQAPPVGGCWGAAELLSAVPQPPGFLRCSSPGPVADIPSPHFTGAPLPVLPPAYNQQQQQQQQQQPLPAYQKAGPAWDGRPATASWDAFQQRACLQPTPPLPAGSHPDFLGTQGYGPAGGQTLRPFAPATAQPAASQYGYSSSQQQQQQFCSAPQPPLQAVQHQQQAPPRPLVGPELGARQCQSGAPATGAVGNEAWPMMHSVSAAAPAATGTPRPRSAATRDKPLAVPPTQVDESALAAARAEYVRERSRIWSKRQRELQESAEFRLQ